MKAKLTLEDGRVIDITITPEQEKAMEVKKVGRWKPSKWETYYVDDCSEVCDYKWDNDSIDKWLYEKWLVYRTEEEAQFARDRKIFITKVNDRIDELNDWWVADWNDSKEWKYYIFVNKNLQNLQINCTSEISIPNIFHYMKSSHIAITIIDEFKDDLMKYIFN